MITYHATYSAAYSATYPELIYSAAATRVREMQRAQAAHEARRLRRVRWARRVQRGVLPWTQRSVGATGDIPVHRDGT